MPARRLHLSTLVNDPHQIRFAVDLEGVSWVQQDDSLSHQKTREREQAQRDGHHNMTSHRNSDEDEPQESEVGTEPENTALQRAQHGYQSLLHQLQTIQDRVMRRELLGERLLHMDVDAQTELLGLICLHSPRDPQTAQLLVAWQDQTHATHKLTYNQIRDIYQHARERGYHHVQRLFLSLTPSHDPNETRLRAHPEMAEIPLGERKFLARKLDIHLLEKLLNDPDAAVIRNLLRNPRITEKEALTIATKRPNHPEILEEIARSPRWFHRYRIKSALVQNPYTPFPIALQALSFLNTHDLEEVAQSSHLHPQLVATAQEFLRLREFPSEPL